MFRGVPLDFHRTADLQILSSLRTFICRYYGVAFSQCNSTLLQDQRGVVCPACHKSECVKSFGVFDLKQQLEMLFQGAITIYKYLINSHCMSNYCEMQIPPLY